MVYLGFELSADRLAPEQQKCTKIQEWETPVTHEELNSMLGFFTYYRRFIPCYSKKVNPLNDLNNTTDQPYTWTMECEVALAQIKEEFANSMKLAFPDFSKEFYLEVDASHLAFACPRGTNAQITRNATICIQSISLRGPQMMQKRIIAPWNWKL